MRQRSRREGSRDASSKCKKSPRTRGSPVFSDLGEALGRIQQYVLDEEDPKELAKTLLALQKFRSGLGDVIDQAHWQLSGRLERKEMDLGPGIGVVRRSRDVKTTW